MANRRLAKEEELGGGVTAGTEERHEVDPVRNRPSLTTV